MGQVDGWSASRAACHGNAAQLARELSGLAQQWRERGETAGWADGVGTSAEFLRPRGVACDGADLYVSDTDNFVVRHVALPGNTVTTIAGQATVPAHQVGKGDQAGVDKPMDLHYDTTSGALFIAEHTVIRRMIVAPPE